MGVCGDVMIIYPKPYSIYLRGTITPPCKLLLHSLTTKTPRRSPRKLLVELFRIQTGWVLLSEGLGFRGLGSRGLGCRSLGFRGSRV